MVFVLIDNSGTEGEESGNEGAQNDENKTDKSQTEPKAVDGLTVQGTGL